MTAWVLHVDLDQFLAAGEVLRHPELVGGVGVYRGNSVHGPFAHVDARGVRARWGRS